MKKSLSGKEFQGFPDYYREFIWNGLSVRVDASGGIEAMRIVRHEENTPVAIMDVEQTQLFGRSGNKCMIHPLYGPAIGFYTETASGRIVPHYPQQANIRPDGFESHQKQDGFTAEYDFLILDQAFYADFRCHGAKTFTVLFSKNHMNNGKFASSFNPMPAEAKLHNLETFLQPKDLKKPFPSGCGILSWDAATLNNKDGILELKAILEYPFGQRNIFFSIGCSCETELTEDDNFYCFRCSWENRDAIRFALAMGSSKDESSSRLHTILSSGRALWQERENQFRKLIGKLPKWTTSLPLAQDFFKYSVAFGQALLLNETECSAGVKAAVGKYGFCAVWDHTLSIRSMLLAGRQDISTKMLRLQACFPHLRFAITFAPLWICQLEDHIAFTGDMYLLRDVWPKLLEFFGILKTVCDSNNGLLRCGRGYGVDRGYELGFDGTYYSSDVNGILFDAFRAVENLAYSLGENATADEARELASITEKRYVELFFDKKAGYLRSGITEIGKANPYEVFQNVATIPLEYPYGAYLLRNVIGDLARYQSNILYDARGMVAVSRDSRIHCEMWRNCHMNQHLGHEGMLARLAGHPEDSKRLLHGFLQTYEKHHVAAETFNLAGCMGDEANNADWQSFAAAGALDALCGGVFGIVRHLGGLHYIPSPGAEEASLEGFLFRGKRWNIRITGKGNYARSYFNGKSLPGTLQVPQEIYALSKIDWEIRLSNKKHTEPVLLSMIGTGIEKVLAKPGRLSFQITEKAHAIMHIQCDKKAKVLVNGEQCSCERIGNELYLDRLFFAGDCIVVEE